jgi:glycosyltransferase involved in cell wall biosynthesis
MLQERRLRRLEAAVGAQVEAICCVSVEDAQALGQLGVKTQRVVIPNSIDTNDYDPAGFATPQLLGPHDLVFTGKMDYRPNLDAAVWFAESVLPSIRAQDLQARFVVVGQRPGRAVRRLGSMEAVAITGGVADARPYIAQAAVYVAPLRMGGGTRFKLLEAMALARPVVSTRLGAEGFAVTHDRELLLADGPEALAEACLRVLTQGDLAVRLGQAGRKFVRANHDWAVVVPRLELLYTTLGANN